jgi:phosphoribosylpyrophosphate synthetase
MARRTKLLLIPCSGLETLDLTKDIYKILRNDYSLGDQVEYLGSNRQSEIPKGTPKDHQHSLVDDYFPDKEIQTNIGRNELKDVIRGKHIALVEHLLTPNRKEGVNDHIMTVRGILDVVSRTETEYRTLVAPYLTYVRSHSIEKYESQGFFQFDSLKKTLKDYKGDGLDAIITIDPHSEKAEQIAEALQMDFYAINPFQSARAINPAKLGLKGQKAKNISKRFRVFQDLYLTLKKKHNGHLYGVSLDGGAERRSENFIERTHPELEPHQFYQLLAYLDKVRISYEEKVVRFKSFSAIHNGTIEEEANIDPEGVYVGFDDMWASGSTADEGAKLFKDKGAKRFELFVSHAITMEEQVTKANGRKNIDKVTCLDTVPVHKDLNVEVIPASAQFLAAELYKAHQKLISG